MLFASSKDIKRDGRLSMAPSTNDNSYSFLWFAVVFFLNLTWIKHVNNENYFAFSYIAASSYSQETPVTPQIKLDSSYLRRFFKSPKFKLAPSINIARTIHQHKDVAIIDMPKPVLLFENKMGEVYEQPADKMRYPAPYNNSKMPVRK